MPLRRSRDGHAALAAAHRAGPAVGEGAGTAGVPAPRQGRGRCTGSATGGWSRLAARLAEPAGERLPPEAAAAVLAVCGARRGDVVLDLSPWAGLGAALAAMTGEPRLVPALVDPEVGGLHDGRAAGQPVLVAHAQHPPLLPGSVSRAVLVAPRDGAADLMDILGGVRPALVPGGRLVLVAALGAGPLGDAPPAVLERCGYAVAHAEQVRVRARVLALVAARRAR